MTRMHALFSPRRPLVAPPGAVVTVHFSLISHTNAGKTTLARTLLRRDVGDALDQSHVTDAAEAWPMIETEGARLVLWDTPGFGDSARLLKRLKMSGQPLRWMIEQWWDRFRDRPLWCSQQAVRNAQEEADVVLYLVNAAESPESASYVGMEMEILSWIGKPVVVLLNQTGPRRSAVEEELEEAEWRWHLQGFSVVRAVLGLDAFARCWVQEGELMEHIAGLLGAEKREAFGLLRRAWEARHVEVFHQAMAALADPLVENAGDQVAVSQESFLQKLGVGRGELHGEMGRARAQLSARLEARAAAAMDQLIALHGLEGHSAPQVQAAAGESFGVPRKVNESLWSAVGGALTGAAGGIVAELKTGGLLLGGGALTGMLLGGAGSYLLARGYNLTRGEGHAVRWTEEHFAAQWEVALLCYLAVAHYGRGRGEWQDSEPPAPWREAVQAVVAGQRRAIDALWKAGGSAGHEQARGERTRQLLTRCAASLLGRLYPRVRLDWLEG